MKCIEMIRKVAVAGAVVFVTVLASGALQAQSLVGVWVDDRGGQISIGQDGRITLPNKQVLYEYRPAQELLIVQEPDGRVGQWRVIWQSPNSHVQIGQDGRQTVFHRAQGGGQGPYGPGPNGPYGPDPNGPYSPVPNGPNGPPVVSPLPQVDPYQQAEIDAYQRQNDAAIEMARRENERRNREYERRRKQAERDRLAASALTPVLSQTPLGAPVGRLGGQVITEGIQARKNVAKIFGL